MTDQPPVLPDPDQLDLRPLPGSERPSAPDATPVPVPADADVIEVTVHIRRRATPSEGDLTQPVDHQEFADRFGADPADIAQVSGALSRLGASIVSSDQASGRLRISGTAALLGRIFGTRLTAVSSTAPNGESTTHRHRTGGLSVPAELDGLVTALLGLDNRPQSRAQFRVAAAAAAAAGYTPLDLGRVYDFPPGTDGSGQTIAIIELGGGFAQSDLDAYFSELGISGPTVTAVGVDGGSNVPGQDPNGADGEVLLDIEVAGALAPRASIVVYFAPNTDAGFVDAVSQAAHATPTPSAISISWGQSEDDWTTQAKNAFDQALTDAAALGATVTVAAGDDGSTDRAPDGKPHVDFPAASPHALACGGTRLTANAATGAVSSEVVWNNGAGNGATGGGVSDSFPLPSWQAHAGVPSAAGRAGRGVPDVSAVADPQTGYRVRVDGTDLVIGGTSAVAPLWAALIARLVQGSGKRLGLAQPMLYRSAAAGSTPAGFRDITSGDNGAYQAGPGWDACTGLGVPNGTELLAALTRPATG